MTMPSAKACGAPAVVGEYCVRNRGGGRVFVVLREHDIHAVGRQHFERAGTSRHRQRVRVDAEEQRAIDALLLAVIANGLTDGQNMPFVEAAFSKAEPRCPEVPNATRCAGTEGSGTSV